MAGSIPGWTVGTGSATRGRPHTRTSSTKMSPRRRTAGARGVAECACAVQRPSGLFLSDPKLSLFQFGLRSAQLYGRSNYTRGFLFPRPRRPGLRAPPDLDRATSRCSAGPILPVTRELKPFPNTHGSPEEWNFR